MKTNWKWKINYHKESFFDYVTECSGLRNLGIKNVRDVYAYDYGKVYQYYIVDKPQGKFVVNHFVYSTGVADWIEKKYIKEGKKPTPKSYHQNVAIDFDTRKQANDYIIKQFKNK